MNSRRFIRSPRRRAAGGAEARHDIELAEDQSGGSGTILQPAGRWPGRPTFEVSRNAQREQTLSGYPTIVSTPILSGLHHRYARI